MDDRTALINELSGRKRIDQIRNARRKLLFICGFSILFIGVSFLLIPEFYVEFLYGRTYDTESRYYALAAVNIKILGGFLSMISSIVFAYLYMVGFSPKQMRKTAQSQSLESNTSSFNNESIAIVSLLKSINESLEKGKLESTLSQAERKEVINTISNTVESHLNESLLNKIENKYGTTVHASKLSELALSSLDKTVNRLSKYADDLKNKAAVNLSYGILSTAISICILIYVLFNASAPDKATTIQEVFYYSSRLFLVLLVQGVSIFFLNLYKATINNIMYLNNELTNYEAKRDALSIALSSGSFDSASSMLMSLSNTERNFILKKGEISIYDKNSSNLQSQISETFVTDLLSKLNAVNSGSA